MTKKKSGLNKRTTILIIVLVLLQGYFGLSFSSVWYWVSIAGAAIISWLINRKKTN